MSESQSRYSIVERLTSTKLDIMKARSDLDSKITHLQQQITMLSKELESYGQESEEDRQRELRKRARELEKMQEELKHAQERKDGRSRLYDAQVAEIDKALKAIEDISQAAAKQEGLG